MFKWLVRYFLSGLLLVLPACFTVYIIYSFVGWLDEILPSLTGFRPFPGAGVIAILLFITIMGFIGSSIIARSTLSFMEYYMYKIPLINLVYSSTKDVIGAFVGDKKKFDKPVLVRLVDVENTYRIGFITRDSLNSLGLDNMMAVYFPDSYGFTGNLFVVHKDNVKFIEASPSEVMKMIVSGGVTGNVDDVIKQ